MIFGKLAGAFFGYLITNTLSGAVLGAVLGHLFDRGLGARLRDPSIGSAGGGWQRRPAVDAVAGQAFFDATFAVMGHVSKADGRVDESEIAAASATMDRMRLDPERRRAAIALFQSGKSPDFDLGEVLEPLREAAAGQTALFVMFLQIQVQAAMADGDFDAAEEAVLLESARLLGVPALVFRQIQMIARMSRGQAGGPQGGYGPAGGQQPAGRAAPTLADAFAVLGVPPDADRATTKAAWRRQISENHPDKLVSKGLPKEMMEAATERSQTIQKAWDTIREAKGWR